MCWISFRSGVQLSVLCWLAASQTESHSLIFRWWFPRRNRIHETVYAVFQFFHLSNEYICQPVCARNEDSEYIGRQMTDWGRSRYQSTISPAQTRNIRIQMNELDGETECQYTESES